MITKELINIKKEIKVSFNIERKQINLKLDKNERYIKTFKENNVDATSVQIRTKDRVYEDLPAIRSTIYQSAGEHQDWARELQGPDAHQQPGPARWRRKPEDEGDPDDDKAECQCHQRIQVGIIGCTPANL